MIIPKGFYTIYQPKYRTPCMFDLNKRGMFKSQPPVTQPWGYRIVAKNVNEVLMQVFGLMHKTVTDPITNQRYDFLVEEALVELDSALNLNATHVTAEIPDFPYADDLSSEHQEWRDAFVPADNKGNVDQTALDSKIEAGIVEAKEKRRQELIRKNSPWVKPVLPRMIQDFENGLYLKMTERLFDKYRELGGEGSEQELIKKIVLFEQIIDNAPWGNMEKPDGGQWQDDDEIRECWMGFAGSEKEAERICQALDFVLPEVKNQMA